MAHVLAFLLNVTFCISCQISRWNWWYSPADAIATQSSLVLLKPSVSSQLLTDFSRFSDKCKVYSSALPAGSNAGSDIMASRGQTGANEQNSSCGLYPVAEWMVALYASATVPISHAYPHYLVTMLCTEKWTHLHFASICGWYPSSCQVTTLGKLLTPMCLSSPSSIIWYLARASCLNRCHVAATHGSNEQGKYCSSGFAAFSRLNRDINYLLYFFYFLYRHSMTLPMNSPPRSVSMADGMKTLEITSSKSAAATASAVLWCWGRGSESITERIYWKPFWFLLFRPFGNGPPKSTWWLSW